MIGGYRQILIERPSISFQNGGGLNRTMIGFKGWFSYERRSTRYSLNRTMIGFKGVYSHRPRYHLVSINISVKNPTCFSNSSTLLDVEREATPDKSKKYSYALVP